MTSANHNTSRVRLRLRAPVLFLSVALVATVATAGVSGPAFSKVFALDTIGPGSTAMLTFTIDNTLPGEPAGELAFSDILPMGVTLAAPAFVSNDCGGTVTAPDGGTTVSLADGQVGIGDSCTVVVNVTAGLVDESDTTYMNVSGALTSTLGNSGTASDDLDVVKSLPGFYKSFAPSTIEFGERSTLTFTIDNSANASAVDSLDFSDVMPTGMVVADPANASTDCGTATIPPTLIAIPGADTITLDANGIGAFPALGVGATCTVVVDVVGGAIGSLGNVSGNLLANFVEAGKAAAVLEVTDIEELLQIQKEFIDDPVAPGGATTLEFTITNKSRDETATDVSFDDDLEMTLPGLAPSVTPLPTDPCGAGSMLTFGGGLPISGGAGRTAVATLTLAGGSLAPESSCTFSVELLVPGSAAPGSYLNTAGPVTGLIGGEPEIGNAASDLLFVVAFPVLTKEFTDDPVAAGGSVTLEFTITNPASSAMSDITFIDELTDNSGDPGSGALGNGFLPFPVSVTIPAGDPCGTGSSLSLIFIPGVTDRQGLELTGGSLAAGGSPGDSCTFSVTVDIPEDFAGGTYTNTTEAISGTVMGGTVVGPPASDTIVIAGAPKLTKEFTDDPVLPDGGTVTLEFNLSYEPEGPAPDATAIAFTDDLTFLAGLTATSVDSNTCAGTTVDITTDPTMIDFSGGTLTAGSSCEVTLTLTVAPGAMAGIYTNITSDVTATIDGLMATNVGAEDDLVITPVEFSKEFVDDPTIPGGTVDLVFTIENLTASTTFGGIFFTDNLSAALPGLVASSLPPSPIPGCGAASSITGTSFLIFTGGEVGPGAICTFTVTLDVPTMVPDGDYGNVTSSLTATSPSVISVPPAIDNLFVQAELLGLTKEFTDDPVLPDSPVTLEFTVTNLSATETITDIAFDDDLDAALTGLEASGATFNDCGGMAAGFPAGLFEYSGGTLVPGGSCTIVLTVDVPPAPLSGNAFLNTTTGVSGKVGTLDVFGTPASDTLEVRTLTFSKSFDGPTTATGTAELTFTITNFDSANGVLGLAFSDDLEDVISGLTATLPPTPDPPCGVGSALAGTSFLAFTGGSLAAAGSPGDSCSFAVTVTVPGTATAGTFVNTTSDLLQSGLPVDDPATANLEIEPPPLFSKVFAPDTIFTDEVSKLTFTIDNSASALAATGLDFTDVLPSPVVVATPSGATTDCTGGTLTAVDGSDTITYTGGEVAAGASCTLEVDVTSDTDGMFVNNSGDLTSSSGSSGAASDTLTVDPAEADLALVKGDAIEPVMTASFQVYELTVSNAGPADATGVTIDDVLPAGTSLVVAEPTGICGETAGVVTCVVGDLAVGESATVTIMLYVEPTEMPVSLVNMATVSSDVVDPDPGNDAVMEDTEVIPFTGLAMLDDVDMSGYPEAAVPLPGSIDVLVKDVESAADLHTTEVFPGGWALTGFEKVAGNVAVMAVESGSDLTEVRVIDGASGAMVSTSMVPAGFLPLAMTVIPDDGTGRTLIVTASIETSGRRGKVHAFDASNGVLVSEFFLHPGAVPVAVAGVSSFVGDAVAELGIVWVNAANGGKRLQVKQLTGAAVNTQNLPKSMFPVDATGVPDCCHGASDELAALGWDQASNHVRVQVLQASGGGFITDASFASGGQPQRIRLLSSAADDLVMLIRNPALRAAVQVRDVVPGMVVWKTKYGPPVIGGSVPLGVDVSPSAYDTVVDEVSVYWLNALTGDMFVTVVDGDMGAEAAEVPIP